MNETPMRQRFLIEDKEQIELIKKIFYVIDQEWYDVQAFDIHLLLDEFISQRIPKK